MQAGTGVMCSRCYSEGLVLYRLVLGAAWLISDVTLATPLSIP